jgi:hypothetical protein
VQVIDINPDLLRQSAEAALHAARWSWNHVDGEAKDDIPALLQTLVKEGPYAYSIMSEVHPDGKVSLPIATTREGIQENYEIIHKSYTDIHLISFVEIRGEWYTFHEGVASSLVKATGLTHEGDTIALFPVTTGQGITGELVWSRIPRSALGVGHSDGAAGDERELRRDSILKQDRYLDALRSADVDGMLAVLNDDVQSAVRDYVNDTGTLASLDGKEAHRAYYASLFGKYEIQSVDLLRRVAQDWYLFSELRMTVSARSGPDAGIPQSFNTAEFWVPAHDDRFIVRVGHGTDPV